MGNHGGPDEKKTGEKFRPSHCEYHGDETDPGLKGLVFQRCLGSGLRGGSCHLQWFNMVSFHPSRDSHLVSPMLLRHHLDRSRRISAASGRRPTVPLSALAKLPTTTEWDRTSLKHGRCLLPVSVLCLRRLCVLLRGLCPAWSGLRCLCAAAVCGSPENAKIPQTLPLSQ